MAQKLKPSSDPQSARQEPALSQVDGRLVISAGLIHLANKGVVDAQLMLSKIHRSAHPQLHDMEKALHWLCKAAEQGHIEAQLQIGAIHESGDGVPRDPELATLYYCDAALGGHPEGAYRLGSLFYVGKKVTRDWVSAYAWFSLARELGNREVGKAMKKIKQTLSKDEREEADILHETLRDMRLDKENSQGNYPNF